MGQVKGGMPTNRNTIQQESDMILGPLMDVMDGRWVFCRGWCLVLSSSSAHNSSLCILLDCVQWLSSIPELYFSPFSPLETVSTSLWANRRQHFPVPSVFSPVHELNLTISYTPCVLFILQNSHVLHASWVPLVYSLCSRSMGLFQYIYMLLRVHSCETKSEKLSPVEVMHLHSPAQYFPIAPPPSHASVEVNLRKSFATSTGLKG